MFVKSIMAQDPQLDGEVVVVEVNNKSQESICEYYPLVEYLRRNLSAPNIVIRTNLVENAEVVSSTPYTAKQKLDAMLVENSHLQSLITKFGLAFDY